MAHLKSVGYNSPMIISSPAFENNQPIPAQFTCDGQDISPELNISDVPAEAQSLVLICDDPDAPAGSANPGWVHWIVFNIDPVTTKIESGTKPIGIEAMNDFRKTEYGGPCPPSGTHRYFYRLYAIDTKLDFDQSVTKQQLLAMIKDHTLDTAELVGLYTKSD